MPDIKSRCLGIESSDTKYYVRYVQIHYMGIRMTYLVYSDSLSRFLRLYFIGFWNKRRPCRRKRGRKIEEKEKGEERKERERIYEGRREREKRER